MGGEHEKCSSSKGSQERESLRSTGLQHPADNDALMNLPRVWESQKHGDLRRCSQHLALGVVVDLREVSVSVTSQTVMKSGTQRCID